MVQRNANGDQPHTFSDKKVVQSRPDIESGSKPTNHSERKHLIQKLQDKGVDNAQIMQISDHKNVASIKTYSRQQQRSISEVSTDTTISLVQNIVLLQHTSTDVIPNKPSTSIKIQVPLPCFSQMSSEIRVSSYL